VALTATLVALIPAELLLETGLEARRDCTPSPTTVVNGVCAAPWNNEADVTVSTAAVLTARLNWVDAAWAAVPEGASKRMNPAEVRSSAAVAGGRRALAADCRLTATPCAAVAGGCGAVVVQNTGGPSGWVAVRSSLMPNETGRAGGGTAFGNLVLSSTFLFWDVPPAGARQSAAADGGRYRIAAGGVEFVLGATDTRRLLAAYRSRSTAPLTLPVTPAANGRAYALDCATDGLTGRDLAHALSLFRGMQLGSPGVLTFTPHEETQALPPPLTVDGALRAVFALKADDLRSTCGGEVPVYTECGAMDWGKAVPLGGVASLLVAAATSVAVPAAAVGGRQGRHGRHRRRFAGSAGPLAAVAARQQRRRRRRGGRRPLVVATRARGAGAARDAARHGVCGARLTRGRGRGGRRAGGAGGQAWCFLFVSFCWCDSQHGTRPDGAGGSPFVPRTDTGWGGGGLSAGRWAGACRPARTWGSCPPRCAAARRQTRGQHPRGGRARPASRAATTRVSSTHLAEL